MLRIFINKLQAPEYRGLCNKKTDSLLTIIARPDITLVQKEYLSNRRVTLQIIIMKSTFLLSYIQSANHKLTILLPKNRLDWISMCFFFFPCITLFYICTDSSF